MKQVITGDKMLLHIDRVLNDNRPITADIFLNNYCNNSCPYCTYRRWEFDNGARYMPFEDFVKYATRLRELGVLGFILTGGGEPTIAKDFQKIVDWMDENGYKYGINTNFNKYVLCKPQYLKVSLDGGDSASYRRSRGVDSYEQVRDNIIRFAKEKDPQTKLGIQLLAKTDNDVRLFYGANKDLPVDYMVIRPVESTDGCYYEKLDSDYSTTPDAIIKTIKLFAKTDKRVVMNYKWNFLGTKYESCIGQWAQIAVNEIGEVMYCCHKPYQIIGHIMDDDILEKKRNAVTDMKMCDVPCRLTGPNYDIQKILGKNITNQEFI